MKSISYGWWLPAYEYMSNCKTFFSALQRSTASDTSNLNIGHCADKFQTQTQSSSWVAATATSIPAQQVLNAINVSHPTQLFYNWSTSDKSPDDWWASRIWHCDKMSRCWLPGSRVECGQESRGFEPYEFIFDLLSHLLHVKLLLKSIALSRGLEPIICNSWKVQSPLS